MERTRLINYGNYELEDEELAPKNIMFEGGAKETEEAEGASERVEMGE